MKLVVEDPVFSNKDLYFLSTEEAFDDAMRKSVHFVQVTNTLGITDRINKHYFKR